jgi:hypothetical protein
MDFPPAEVELMQRVRRLAGPILAAFAPSSSVPEAWWAALTANETGEWLIHNLIVPSRFEPRVFEALERVVAGMAPRYGSITPALLQPFDAAGLHALASSWGLTQVMGYNALAHGHTVAQLNDPMTHYPIAASVLAEFVAADGLDPSCDFAEMFDCWNTGRPRDPDPVYVANGLLRLAIWQANLSGP